MTLPLEYDAPPQLNGHAGAEAEMSLLASVLYDPATVRDVLKLVSANDFVDPALRAVFQAITARHFRGDEVAAELLMPALRETPTVDNANVLIADIAAQMVTGAHATLYARQVREASQRRQLDDLALAARDAVEHGTPIDEAIADLQTGAELLASGVVDRSSVDSFTLKNLVEQFPAMSPPVVDGLFREGETANIIAASKVGKSWLGYGLALSIIAGIDWLGRFPCSAGRVLLIDNELHPQTLANRIPAVALAMGLQSSDYENDLVVWPLRGNLRSLQDLGAEFDKIEPGEFKLILVDAKYRIIEPGASENDNASETQVYNLLDQYAAKTRAAFGLVHHASKGNQTGKSVTDVGSGAGAQSRATDAHVVLRDHEEEGAVVLDAAVRSFKPIEPVVMKFEFPLWRVDPALDPQALRGRLGKGQEAKAKEDATAKERIIEALDGDVRLTNRQLRKPTGLGKDRLGRLLDVLESEGLVTSEEITKGGRVTDEFRLNK